MIRIARGFTKQLTLPAINLIFILFIQGCEKERGMPESENISIKTNIDSSAIINNSKENITDTISRNKEKVLSNITYGLSKIPTSIKYSGSAVVE